MRVWLSILFSLLLAGAQTVQTVEPASASTSEKAACGCSGCDSAPGCACSTVPASQPQPLPLAPTRTTSQTEAQWLAASTVQMGPTPVSSTANPPFPLTSSFAEGRVPLYQRDCTYLV